MQRLAFLGLRVSQLSKDVTPAGQRHVTGTWVIAMEQAIDGYDLELAPLTAFILPGGSPAAAALHLALTGCRRAERHVVPFFRR